VSKSVFFIIIFFIISHCSVDNKTGLWIDKKNPDIKIELSKINFDKKLTYEEFRKNVVLFGKKSKYPKLMEKQ
tara:strand:- start:377 stop:595 length:219 start_codon:yes stop_codon:yes gene_type:complete